MHLLASIATGGLVHKGSIEHFFASTFLGASMPPSQLRERLNTMLDWLVEERFIRKCGMDEHYTPRWVDGAVDEEEAWDDTVPAWAMNAKTTEGVSWEPQSSSSLHTASIKRSQRTLHRLLESHVLPSNGWLGRTGCTRRSEHALRSHSDG